MNVIAINRMVWVHQRACIDKVRAATTEAEMKAIHVAHCIAAAHMDDPRLEFIGGPVIDVVPEKRLIFFDVTVFKNPADEVGLEPFKP